MRQLLNQLEIDETNTKPARMQKVFNKLALRQAPLPFASIRVLYAFRPREISQFEFEFLL
jgi:hypothetical protein